MSAPSSGLRELLGEMRADFLAARDVYDRRHKSGHWDVFRPDFERLIDLPEAWPDFRRNGIAAGMQTSFDKRLMDPPSEMVPFREPAPQRLGSEDGRQLEGLFRALAAMIGEDLIDALCDTEVGHPQVYPFEGRQLNLNELLLSYHAWQVARFSSKGRDLPQVIVEIGGGYGSLAAKMKQLFPAALVLLLDLPEVNAIQSWYLAQRFPDARRMGYVRFLEEGKPRITPDLADFLVLPGWCMEDLGEDLVDLVLNLRSMMEMRREIIAFYFAGIQRVLRPSGRFYCVNRYQKRVGEELSTIKNYPFDGHWQILLSQACWAQSHIHELLLERRAEDVEFPPSFVLASLP